MSGWRVILCKPRRERQAEDNLQRLGYDVYLPCMANKRRRDGRWVETVEPLFPRYLFLDARDATRNFAPVRSTLGVAGVVRFGGVPALVPDDVIAALRSRADPASALHLVRTSPFRAGEQIRFAAGPLTGLEGVFEIESGDARAIVLMEFLGKTNRLTVNCDWLVAAG
jgi:transcriptional antiterminator RfaH